jgi:peptide/nickel transport system substrate-binding protein
MYLIDRDVVNRLRFGDRAEGEGGGESIVSPIFAPQWAVNPNLDQYAHDPELARQMLEEAGWDFSRELVYQSFSAEEEDPLALYVQQAFADIGINVRIRKSAFSGFYDIFAEGDFDLWFEAGFDGAHPSTSVITFHCEAWNAKMAGFCNPEFDELLLKSASTIDEQEAKTIAWRMSEILNDELPWLWANRDPVNILVHDRLQNYVWTPVLDVSETWSILNWELK